MRLSELSAVDPATADAIRGELRKQRENVMLVASSNYLSPAVLAAQGSLFANMRAEGYPGSRYFAGTDFVDQVEQSAIDRAKQLFGADHVNVQPHSGTQANMAAYVGLLDPGSRILSLELSHGGHLSHGHDINFAGQYYEVENYSIDVDTDEIDYRELERLAREFEPDLIVTGFSAYPREIDWRRVQDAADDVSALQLADISHISGLIAAGQHPSPVGIADVVTGSTHKSIRAGRGGFIMCDEEYADAIDTGVFPGAQGDPMIHNIAGKAVGFKEALSDEFDSYAAQIVRNAETLADVLRNHGFDLVSGGTDTHLLLVDLRDTHPDLTGTEAEAILEDVNIILNSNSVPGDHRPPKVTSGIRIGTPAVTTRGLTESDMQLVGESIAKALNNPNDTTLHDAIRDEITTLCAENRIYESYSA